MNISLVISTLAVAAAALAAGLAGLAWMASRRAAETLRMLLEQVLAGERAEAETTRAALAAAEGRLRQAIQSGTTDALSRSFEQIGSATQNMATTIDALRRQAGEDAQKTLGLLETRLGAIQNSVNEKLHEAVEKQMTASFARVLEQFAQVQQAVGEVQSAAAQIGDLKRLFSNVKTRGGWGEAQLGAMLEQVLPPGAFERNFALRDASRERVDFAIRMPSRVQLWLPVDAKFPTEDYDRLILATEAADAEAERAAREGMAGRLRLEARKIREKYILPPETVEFAVLYLPSDGLFAEVARIPNLIDEIRQKEKVIVLGPTLLPALLQTIHLGHITLDLEKRAGEIGKLLGATRAEMTRMDELLARLAASAATMSNNIEKVRVRTRAVSRVLRTVEVVEGERGTTLLGLEQAEAE
jgi:DNA recombination protein RmuC